MNEPPGPAAPVDGLPPDGDLVTALEAALKRVAQTVMLARQPSAEFADLTIRQMRCLLALGQSDGLRMAELAEAVDSKLPALSQIVARMECRGMVERRADPSDRRAVQVWLTHDARRGLEREKARRLEHLRAIRRHLSAEAATGVVEALRALAAAAERARPGSPNVSEDGRAADQADDAPPVTVRSGARQDSRGRTPAARAPRHRTETHSR